MTNADILLALGMSGNRIGQGIVLARYTGDTSMLIEVHDAGLGWAWDMAAERSWHINRASVQVTLRMLVWLVIDELVEPQLCRSCQGRGNIFAKKRLLIEKCHVCRGAGVRERGDRARARFIHVDYRGWRRRWRERHRLVYVPLAETAARTLREMNKKLG